ncbi:peptidoglycan/LPS O-acetylase OafA/YrhL [Pseudarthrobacter sp. W1I19]|uniref:acyltransferase family protein n=1 Tax=Pseudarthrobacter sp. W1I19 TaxID=3042288 RepID=UPI0027862602|nr:acyltransferase [Pseudarthrobacter sp. W1I19]MDQ0922285.1 peptidoglycan/LPS O-acetylase OafA/YrhL [Pseudarthrobacter sp. W1I19]
MGRRLEGLDGLRGIAALIVVFSHTALIFPTWADGLERSSRHEPDAWVSAVQRSPFNALFAGGEAVFVFFILSGFVLVLPFFGARSPSWVSYYPKRLLRLYVPIVAAVVLTAVLVAAVPRVTSPEQTWWVDVHSGAITLKGLVREAFALLGTGRYNSVLWSLKWELIFSLLLPVFVLLAVLLRRWWLAGASGMILLASAGLSIGSDCLQYLPMFGIGAFLAAGYKHIGALADRKAVGIASMAAAAVLFSAVWSTPGVPARRLLLLIACTALVIAFLVWSPAIRFSSRRTVVWLATRSFSLYLVHEPIIVSATLVFPGAPWLAVAVAWPVVVLTTELFFRLIEDPSRRLANWVGSSAAARAARRWGTDAPMPGLSRLERTDRSAEAVTTAEEAT